MPALAFHWAIDMVRASLILILWVLALPSFAVAQAAPQRIVSLNLCTDQLLILLADRAQIASVSFFATDKDLSLAVDAAAQLPINHGLAEQIFSYNPDLVLTGPYTARFASSLLAQRGVPVLSVPPATTIEDVRTNVMMLARAIGHEDRGAALIAAMDQQLAAISIASPPRTALVLAAGGATVGKGSFQTALMNRAGLINQAAQNGVGAWGLIGLEGVIRAAPHMLIIEEAGLKQNSTTRDFLTHPALQRMVDAGRTQVIYVDSRLWSCGLPVAAKLVDQLAQKGSAR